MKVRYAGKVYEVNETKVIPGGIVLYGIEDEQGHIDFVSNVQVLEV